TKSDWVPIDTELGDAIVERFDASAYLLSELQPDRGGNKPLAEVTRDKPWRFEFEASRDGCDELCIHLLDDPRSRDRTVRADWFSGSNELPFVVFVARVSTLRKLPDGHLELVLPYRATPRPGGRSFAIEISSENATADAPIRIARGGKGKGYRPRAG